MNKRITNKVYKRKFQIKILKRRDYEKALTKK